jgi:MYXO-CTERM domain-containing protein
MRLALPGHPVADGTSDGVRHRLPIVTFWNIVIIASIALSAACSDDESNAPSMEDAPGEVTPVIENRDYTSQKYHFAMREKSAFAANPRHRFQTRIGSRGARVLLDEGAEMTLALAGIGRHSLHDAKEGRVEPDGARVDVVRGDVTEYFVNGPAGLEHGFEVARRPDGEGTLTLTVEFDGCSSARVGSAIALRCGSDSPQLRYDRLHVWDATGRPLHARMRATGSGARILVSDASASYPITIDPTLSRVSQTAGSDSAAGDSFGAALAVADGVAIVGAPDDDDGGNDAGAVFVFTRQSGVWGETQKLTPADSAAGQRFGAAVDVEGELLLIGAPGDDTAGSGMGAAYTFHWDGGQWTEAQKFVPDATGTDFEFGAAVAVGDDEFFVGAPGELDGTLRTGAVHSFIPDPVAPGTLPTYIFASFIAPPVSLAAGDRYGEALEFDPVESFLAVGAPGRSGGVTYVSHTHKEAADPLHLDGEVIATVAPGDLSSGDEFGAAVVLRGMSVLAGAPGQSAGAAYLVAFEDHGNDWTVTQKFTDSAGSAGARFGEAVAFQGPVVAVSAPDDGAGATVAFSRDTGGVGNWGVLSRESSPTGASGDRFGATVGLDVDLVVGAPAEASTGQIHFLELIDEPLASDDHYDTDGQGTFGVGAPGVLGNDVDPEGDALTATLGTTTSDGTLTFNPDGSFSYTPDGGFVGTDTFTYTASDGTNDSNVATVSIVVPPDNRPPDTTDDSATTSKNTAVTVDVLANDSDPDGDPLTLQSVSDPLDGTAAIVNGEVEYTPDTDFSGSDSVTYVVSDGTLTANGTLVVTVTSVNQPPTANNDFVSTDEDTAVTFDPTTNDTDPEGDTLTVDSVQAPTNGTLSQNGNDLTFTPDTNFAGNERLDYTIVDTEGNSASAQITIGVNAIADPPVANDDTVTVDANRTTAIDVLANDTDDDSNTLTIDDATVPPNGSVAIVNGQIEYTPDDFYTGADSFTYTIKDPTGLTDSATVNVTVQGANSAPVWQPPTPMGTIRETAGASVTFTIFATDIDNDTLTYGLNNPPASNPSLDSTTGAFEWMTAAGDSGVWALEFTASDGTDTVTHTVHIELSFADSDNDGVSDEWEEANGLDTTTPDSDGDTIVDLDEVGPDLNQAPDTDDDGTIDALDLDSDGDGFPDAEEAGDDDLATVPQDTDGDGVPDFQDLDSDGDGTDDDVDNCYLIENADQANLDGDESGDACDNDADGDGILDALEEDFGLDPRKIDTDDDTIADGEELGELDEPRDTDEDGTIDALDDDSDGDGVSDLDEAGDDDPTTRAVDTDDDGTPDYRDLDSDGDRVPDAEDNCRVVQNAAQTDTDGNGAGDLCDQMMVPDEDGDGTPDDDDNCPQTRNADQKDTDGDGVGDLCDEDDDDDGVPDAEDNCPLVENPEQQNADEDEQGDTCDPDDDDDGVLDDEDNCPTVANADQADDDDNGVGDACEATAGDSDRPNEGCCTQVHGNASSSPAALLLLVVALLGGLRRRR